MKRKRVFDKKADSKPRKGRVFDKRAPVKRTTPKEKIAVATHYVDMLLAAPACLSKIGTDTLLDCREAVTELEIRLSRELNRRVLEATYG